MRTIGMLLGIPESDQELFRDHTDDNLRTEGGKPMEVTEESLANGELFDDYIEWRVDHPSDDIMTELLHAEFEDETGTLRTLTRQELRTYLAVVSGAGNETTNRLIGWTGKVLAEHPDQRQRAGRGPLPHPRRHRGAPPLRDPRALRRPLHLAATSRCTGRPSPKAAPS